MTTFSSHIFSSFIIYLYICMQIRNIGELLPHSYKQKMNIVMMSLTSHRGILKQIHNY